MGPRYPKIISALGLAGIIALVIYVIFRITVAVQSILISSGILSTLATFLFLFAELFILIQGLGYFTNILRSIRNYERTPISYSQQNYLPAVDVLIPVHDEPAHVLFKTLVATQHIDYENFRIIVLDNSAEATSSKAIKKLCQERGIDYYEVPYPRHGAKAGAINEYLKHLRSPYLAIFDADYRPSRDFLKVTIPQMQVREELAFIQTPQFYGNLEIIPVSKAAQMQQSIFYEYICEGKSLQSAMFMCGTNLLIRTQALRSVGGFDEDSITEDFSTSLRLILKGWKTKYYNQTTAFGDGPRNLREYFRQQYRWARGTLGVFFRSIPAILTSPKLSLAQRIEFILSGSYYLIGIVWLILFIMPPLYILFGIPAYMADPVFYLLAYTPYFLFSLLLFFQTLFIRHYQAADWIKTESLALLTAPVYARASFHALLGKKAHFEKTKKDASIHEIPWDQLYLQLGLIFLSIVAIIVGAIKLFILKNYDNLSLSINLFWCLFHLFLMSYLLIYVLKNKNIKSAY